MWKKIMKKYCRKNDNTGWSSARNTGWSSARNTGWSSAKSIK